MDTGHWVGLVVSALIAGVIIGWNIADYFYRKILDKMKSMSDRDMDR